MLDAVHEFIISKEAASISRSTLIWYRCNLDAFLRWRGERTGWPDIKEIEAFLADERKRLKPISLAGRYRTLNVFFGWCVERELLVVSPMAKIKRPKVPKQKPRSASAEDFEMLLSRIPENSWLDLRDRLAISTMFLCGLRVSEVANLRTGDFNLESGLLFVRAGKGGDDRPVPLLPAVAMAFVRYQFVRPASANAYVFVSRHNGEQLRPNSLRLMLRRRCRAAGVTYLNPHSFRHGLAIHLLNNGGDMSLVQKVLGHSKISTTAEHYAHWLTEGMVRAYQEIMGPSGTKTSI